jgi:hypothetical protein
LLPVRDPLHGGDASALRAFLIADIRGYTRYTRQHGADAAARLAAALAASARACITDTTAPCSNCAATRRSASSNRHAGRSLPRMGDRVLLARAFATVRRRVWVV